MSKDKDENFSLIDLDDSILKSAIIETTGRELTEEEIEDIALEQMETDEGFLLAEKRIAQGLANFPFDGNEVFAKLDEHGNEITHNLLDVLRIVSGWYVRREFGYFDINRLSQSLTKPDLMNVLSVRLKQTFPKINLNQKTFKSLCDALMENVTAEPGLTIPVWSGTTVSMPGSDERMLFSDGMVTINTWVKPAFRNLPRTQANLAVFDEFLTFIFKNPAEKEVFLDWLSWCLQHEDDKPSWAIFLFSKNHGTGKSTLAEIIKKLFGEENTSEQQGIKPIISRFNKPVLGKKLIYAEEVKVAPNSDDGNKLKTLISERQTMAESKGKDIEAVDHRCCFILTTNHKPIWLEPGDRRFYIIHVDHEGYSAGGKEYDTFVDLVKRVKDTYGSQEELSSLYTALLKRQQSQAFNPYSLNVNALATEVMRDINNLSPDIVEEMLAEFLEEHKLLFIPVQYTHKIIEYFAHRNPNASKYSFDSLGWKKDKFAWGGKGPKWAFYHPSCSPKRGIIKTEWGEQSIDQHIAMYLAPALELIGFGITYEYKQRTAPKPDQDDVPF